MTVPFTRREVLGGLAASSLVAIAGGATLSKPRRKLVVVLAFGGWDTTFSLHPKSGVPGFDVPTIGDVKLYADLPIFVSEYRPSVTAFFERAAASTALVHGVSVESVAHPQCLRRILTGSSSGLRGDVAAIAAEALGRDRPLPYLVYSPAAFSGPFAAGTVSAGVTNQLATLIDPTLEPATLDPAHLRFAPDLDDQAAIDEWLRQRLDREVALRGQHGDNARRLADLTTSRERAERLLPYDDVFAPSEGPITLRDQIAQGVTALSRGVSWSVMVDSRLEFDTHAENGAQGPMQESLFDELVRLYDLLASTPGDGPSSRLLDETVVLVVSEMTRTPRLNADLGKDHWPYATLMLFGAGVAGGRGYGDTDALGLGLPVNRDTGAVDAASTLLQPADVLSGVLELVGADPAPYFPGAEVLRAIVA